MALTATQVRSTLQSATQRLRWMRFLRHALAGLVIAVFLLIVFVSLDVMFHLDRTGRWVGFILIAGALIQGVVRAAFAAAKPVSIAAIARRIESSCTGAGNVLISAVQFDESLSDDSPVKAALFKEMRDPFPSANWSAVFDLPLMKRLLQAGAVITLALVAWALLGAGYLANSTARLLMPSSHIASITRTRLLEIQPGDATAVRGTDLPVTVRVGGETPQSVWIRIREAGGDWRREEMTPNSPVFTGTISARQPAEYRIEADDAVSDTFRIAIRPRTAVETDSALITPPLYTHLPPVDRKNFNDLTQVPAGSKVNFSFHFNAPLSKLEISNETRAALEAQSRSAQDWSCNSSLTGNGRLNLSWTDSAGATDNQSITYTVTPDNPPAISVLNPPDGDGVILSPEDSLKVRFRATDDFGLGDVSLFQSALDSGKPVKLASWKDAQGRTSYEDGISLPLSGYKDAKQLAFYLEATDQNNVTGPGKTQSRPIIVDLKPEDEIRNEKTINTLQHQSDLQNLIQLQQANLQGTTLAQSQTPPQGVPDLMTRQEQILDGTEQLEKNMGDSPSMTGRQLHELAGNEIPAAVTALRDAVPASERQGDLLGQAAKLETSILAALKGAGTGLDKESTTTKIADAMSGLEDLLRRQIDLHKQTHGAAAAALQTLSATQDALSDFATVVKKNLDYESKDPSIGDKDLQDRMTKVVSDFGTMKIYEDMLTAADRMQSGAGTEAEEPQKRLIMNLASMLDLLNQWRLANAAKSLEDMKAAVKDVAKKLADLTEIQKSVIEKSKDYARKGEVLPEDVSTAAKLAELKQQRAQLTEEMQTDAHIFPDIPVANELRSQLAEIYEDVQQTDKADADAGKLKSPEIAVQKEDGLLKGMQNAKQLAADMEMWLPNKNDMAQWNLENFDKTEMPEMQEPPLPDEFEDLVGKLLDDQKGLAQKAQDAASNQSMSQNPANGWNVADGPQGSFGAQGKSGNERPNQNEQTGRSSGGREGMSNGEMAGDTASHLEGRTPEARRTKDPFQQGHVQDNDGINHNMATGGGKAGGLSDQAGMDGNAPLRPANAPRMLAATALAAEQAMLAEKTAKTSASAALLYLKSGRLAETASLMQESEQALRDGRIQDFQSLHRQILESLDEVKGDIDGQSVLVRPTAENTAQADSPVTDGGEAQAPAQYRDAVAKYYRSLAEGK